MSKIYFIQDTNNLLKTSNPSEPFSVEVSCVSYIEDSQRIIAFTTDSLLAEFERKKESSSMEIFLSIRGIIISVINNVNLEVSTIALKDSIPIWSLVTADGLTEIKTFTNDYSSLLEREYNNYMNQRSFIELNTIHSKREIKLSTDENKVVSLDFSKMKLDSPENGVLKREWVPGLNVQYRTSANMTSLKCRIFNFQVNRLDSDRK